MEMKVWLDGYQRVVCGVTEQTTCQDIMIALAHASGKTGRFTMIEKWRTNERCLSPTDFPLLILQKWGEYSNDVQLILCHSRVGSGKKHRHHPGSGHPRPASSPPEHVPVKKSLTFSGAHMSSAASNGRIVSHSVESSEQGSVASQSSASLSPYMSLERQTQKAEGNLSNGDFEKDFRIWSVDHLKQNSDDATVFGKPATDGSTSSRATISSQSPVPVISRSHAPVPSVRSSKASVGNAEVGSRMPRPAQRKEEPKQNGSVVLETKRFNSNVSSSWNHEDVPDSASVCSNALNASNLSRALASSRASSVSSNSDVSSNVSSKTPSVRDKNDNLVSDSASKVGPLKMATVKQSDLSRSFEHQNEPSKETPNRPMEISGVESGVGRERPVAARRLRGPVAGNSEGVVPLRTDSPSSNLTHSVGTSVMSRPTMQQAPITTLAPSVESAVTLRPTVKKAPISNLSPSVDTAVTSRPTLKPTTISTLAPSVEASLKQAPISTLAPSVASAVKQAPNSTVTLPVEASVTPRPTVTPQGPGLEDSEQLKELKERKELIELIGRQEREMLICESRLKDLNSEISALEDGLETDERCLESQMQKIEEMEATERQLEEELMELELVSWEDKLTLEKQKENRIRTEILLLQSSIAKSETEILSFVEKIRSLTIKTEEATQELNRFLEEKKEKENKEISDLDSRLCQAVKESEESKSALRSLEDEISAADQSLSKKKEELAKLESQLKKLNLDNFLQEPREIASTRRGRSSVLERLGLSRPGSSRGIRRYDLSPSPLLLNRTRDETNRPALGYVV